MEILHTSLLVLVGLLGSLAQQDLEKKTMIFPEASNTARVVLRTVHQQPLTSFTVCLRAYTDLNRAYSLFSYATKQSDNHILLFKPKSNQYSVYVAGAVVTFSVADNPVPKPQWEHICASWESATGIVELWLNGESLPRKGLKKGHSITPEASIIIGQEQDSYGGGFDVNQSFVGEITDVYMWDRELSPDELALVGSDSRLSNYLIDWKSLNYEIKGYAVVKPTQFG
ncbi:serum amyloid P-component-like [Eublepharis macularius]|uniref:Pentraxin family member n=1 Tax=Eublepharis macularius TaxID=481883 RepID=A0AA97LEV3_EUBMA|nr:serum amyloid P-component-like [Eublepharis macularius]